MRNPFVVLDQYLIDRASEFAKAFHWMTGRTNFYLAKLALAPITLALVTYVLDAVHPFFEPRQPTWFRVFWGVLATFLLMGIPPHADACNRAEKRLQDVGEAVADPHLQSTFWGRMLWFLGTVVQVLALMGAAHEHFSVLMWLRPICRFLLSVGFCAHVFFLAVDPMRPSTSRFLAWIKQWWESTVPFAPQP